jgi:predicted secreted protein
MRILTIYTTQLGRVEVAVEDLNVVKVAHILEASKQVTSFYVDGVGANQQITYGVGDFTKWKDTVLP